MAVTFSSDRTFASMSFTLSFANTGVNNPSFIFSSRGPLAPLASLRLRGPNAPRRCATYGLFVPNVGPDAAVSVTLQNRIDDTRGSIAVVERCECGRLGFVRTPAAGNETVNVAHHVAKRIRPRFLMAAGQMGVPPCALMEQRRIFRQHAVRL